MNSNILRVFILIFQTNYSIVGGVIDIMKNILTPPRTNRTWLGISIIAKSIKSKVQKNELFISHAPWNFSKGIQFRVHFRILVSEFNTLRMCLVFILADCNNFFFMNNQRNMLFLTKHCHRHRLCHGNIGFNYRIYIQLNPS